MGRESRVVVKESHFQLSEEHELILPSWNLDPINFGTLAHWGICYNTFPLRPCLVGSSLGSAVSVDRQIQHRLSDQLATTETWLRRAV